jgi:hypothetical protein
MHRSASGQKKHMLHAKIRDEAYHIVGEFHVSFARVAIK